MNIRLILTIGAGAVVLLLILLRASMGSLEKKGQKIFAILAMGILPCAWMLGVAVYDLGAMQTVDFCVQCHTMRGYRESLTHIPEDEDDMSVVANHYLNNRVSRKTACYQCHADHTPITGPIKTKINGLREAFVEYLGDPPDPVHATKPFPVANCLHCHEVSRKFRQAHEDDLEDIESGKTSCLECHDVAHVVIREGETKSE